MRRDTKKALLASIEHWRELEQVKNLSDVQLGRAACALCQRFGSDCERSTPKTSELCPVRKAAGNTNCRGTPYDSAYWAAQVYDLEKFRTAATRERKFLESLLPAPAK